MERTFTRQRWIKVAAMLSSAGSVGVAPFAVAQTSLQSPTSRAPLEPGGPQDIIVTGVRASIADAVETKKSASQIVEVIGSEDIGKLPDNNIADALSRVPGVQVSPNFGEGAQVAVRGISQVRVELNGRSNLGVSVSATGADSSGRSTGLEQISSTLFSKVSVYKSSAASQVEGGLGGFISAQTPDPFKFKKPTLALKAQYINSDLAAVSSRRNGYDLAAFGSFRAFGGRLAGVINASYSRKFITNNQFIRGLFNTSTLPGLRRDYDANGAIDNIPSGGLRAEYTTVDRRRFGLGGGLKFKASDSLTFSGDGLYTSLVSNRQTDLFSITFTGTGNSASVIQSGTTVNNYLVQARVTNALIQAGGQQTNTPLSALVAGGGFTWKRPGFVATGDIGYSGSQYDFRNDSLQFNSARRTISFDYRTGGVPNVDLGAFDPTARSSYVATSYNTADQHYKLGEWAYRLDTVTDLNWGPLSQVRLGGRYSTLTSNVEFLQQKPTSTSPPINAVPAEYFMPSSSRGFPGVAGNFPSSFLSADTQVRGTGDDTYLFAFGRPVVPRLERNNDEKEKTIAGYVQLDLKADFWNIDLTGNVGVRYFKTNFSVSSFRPVGATFVPAFNKNSYDDFLPSSNFAFTLTNGLILRLAASKTIARANLPDLAPTVVLNNTNLTASVGNNLLRPTKSKQFDLSLEYYFPKRLGAGYAAAAVFTKDLTDQIVRVVTTERVAGTPSNVDYQVTRPINRAAATIRGLELSLQKPLTFLPGILSGLGVQANATFIDYSTSDNSPVAGLSKQTFNFTGFYENNRFNVRAAYNIRSSYVSGFTGSDNGDLRPNYYGLTSRLDLSSSIKLDKKYSFEFSVVNLLPSQSIRRNYNETPDALNILEFNDRVISAGIRARF